MPAHAEISADASQALTRTQQLAALLVMLGPESSAQILSHFQPHEVEAVSREMPRAALITPEQREEILQEFSHVAQAANSIPSPNSKDPPSLRSVATSPAIAEPAQPAGGLQSIAAMEPHQIFALVQGELPQTIALVISHLAPEKAAQVSALCRPELRDKIIERLAKLGPTPGEVVENIVEVLLARLNSHRGSNRIYEMA